MYFTSDMKGGFGGMDLYYCERLEEIWGAPINLGRKINTAGHEVFPYLFNDTLLYFSSDFQPGYGGLDIFVSKILSDTSWSKPTNLYQPINSSYDDFGMFRYQDNDNMMGLFSSSRKQGKGFDDIYSFHPLEQFVHGYVRYKKNMKPAINSTVFLLDSTQMKVRVIFTDSTGQYVARVKRSTGYLAKATKPSYMSDCIYFSFDNANTDKVLFPPRDLYLDKLEIDRVIVMKNIYYDFDKWDIRQDAKKDLDRLVNLMNEKDITVELSSHTDSRGTHPYNERLSQRRAESAVNYILEKGINTERIAAKGYGEIQPVNQCIDDVDCSPAEHQANRRTEIRILNFEVSYDRFLDTLSGYPNAYEADVSAFGANFFASCLDDQSPGDQIPFDQLILVNAPKDTLAHFLNPPESIPCFALELLQYDKVIDFNDPIWRNIPDKNYYFDGSTFHFFIGCFERDSEQLKKLYYRMKVIGFTETRIIQFDENGLVK